MESNENKKTLGQFLKEMRSSKNYTLRFIEESTEISNAYLSQLENDKIKKPSANILYKLADLYKVPFESVLALAGIVENNDAKNKSFKEYVFSKDNLTTEEEEELIRYLKYLREKK